MANFGPKPLPNPLEKISIFRLFKLLVFIAQKGVFSFQNIVKYIFLAYIAQNKRLEKWPILDQNHGLTPLEKISLFRLFDLFVFIAQKGVFSFQNILKHIFLAYIAQNNKKEKWPISDQNHVLTPLENSQCFDFLNVLLLQPRKAFFSFQNIVKHIFQPYNA